MIATAGKPAVGLLDKTSITVTSILTPCDLLLGGRWVGWGVVPPCQARLTLTLIAVRIIFIIMQPLVFLVQNMFMINVSHRATVSRVVILMMSSLFILPDLAIHLVISTKYLDYHYFDHKIKISFH